MAEFHNDTDAWPDMFGELSGPSTDHNQTQKPLTLSLLKNKGRWPDYAEQKLEALMIQHRFFNYHKTNGESARKMQAIVQELRLVFDTTAWMNVDYDELLQKKIRNKVGRIRAAMREKGELVDSEDGLVYQPPSGPATSETISAFQSAALQLAPAKVGQALRCLRSLYGRDTIVEEVVTWSSCPSG